MRRRRAGAAVLGGGRSFHIWASSDVDQMFSSAVRSRLSCLAGTQSCRRPLLQLSLASGRRQRPTRGKDLDLNGEPLSRLDAHQIASCFHSPSLVISVVLT